MEPELVVPISDSVSDSEYASCEDSWIPWLNMHFDSEKDAYNYYNAYGLRLGFGIRREYKNNSRVDNKLTSRLLVCAKEGFRTKDKRDFKTKKAQAETRTGCEARMKIKYDPALQKYRATELHLQHNHPLVAPECSHMLRSQRQITSANAIDVELAADSGIPVRQSYELNSREFGGREAVGFMRADIQNHIRTRRQRELERGEASCLTDYFMDQKCEDPHFIHAVQLDSQELITNVFWADSKMLSDYRNFGDVVTFDTTYKLVDGNRPFGVFLGLNNHRETTIFGAAFMYDETADSFVWLFKTFVKSMQNQYPKTIFTDQDAAMARALVLIMPDTKHLLCTWHLLQNAQKNLGNLVFENVGIKSVISRLMYTIEEVNEFEIQWKKMEQNYNLQNNSWLANLFSMRHVWGLAYIKHVWTGGIRTTQLSESFNASLKQYLARQYKLPDFFRHFENLLQDKRYKESQAQYGLMQKLPRLKHPCPILNHVSELYTAKILDIFEEQLSFAGLNERLKSSTQLPSGICVYEVGTDDQRMPRRVTRTPDEQLLCTCGKFERVGVLCRHILKVMKDVMFIDLIPERYILKRWTIKATEGISDMVPIRDQVVDPRLEIRRRHSSMCRYMNQISSIASCSDEGYQNVMCHLLKLKKIAEGFVPSVSEVTPPPPKSRTRTSTVVLDDNEDTHVLNADGKMPYGFAKKDISKGQRRRHTGPMSKAVARTKRACRSKKIPPPNTTGVIPNFDEHGTNPAQNFNDTCEQRQLVSEGIRIFGGDVPQSSDCHLRSEDDLSLNLSFTPPGNCPQDINLEPQTFSARLLNTPSSYSGSASASQYNILRQSVFTCEPSPTTPMPSKQGPTSRGHEVGVFDNLNDAKKQTCTYPGGLYYSYNSLDKARKALKRWRILHECKHPNAELGGSSAGIPEKKPKTQRVTMNWLKWRYKELIKARNVIVAEFRRIGLPIPKGRAAELQVMGDKNLNTVIFHLNRELHQLYVRWRKIQRLNEATDELDQPSEQYARILNDPGLMSDPDMSDYEDSGDDDFVIPPPTSQRKRH